MLCGNGARNTRRRWRKYCKNELILLDSTPAVEAVAKEWADFFEGNTEIGSYYDGDEFLVEE